MIAFTAKDLGVITSALYAAADQYLKDANAAQADVATGQTKGVQRLADQFLRQEKAARSLAERIEQEADIA
ncbi:MAG: hypothetical protein Q8P46_00295 [Hyphomicrobiales bacterium]|nr:hypothetical protein [Hyphomicrobiales bacterium]